MKEIKNVAEAENFKAVSVGKFSELTDYVLPLAPGVEIPGKVFCGTSLGTSGSELSFQIFAPGKESGFLHTHKEHEELYFFLSGRGEYRVDGVTFPVGEGTVVRVSPKGRRTVRCVGGEPLVMLCVQYRATPFTEEDATDGVILNDPVVW